MRTDAAISPKLEFARRAAVSRDFAQRLQRDMDRRAKDKEKHREQEQGESDLLEFAQLAIMATDSQMLDFELKLDRYDAATVEALMENERELQIVEARLEQRLAQAITLPDGRRVFKTEDRTQVFDENGIEVSPDIISPDAIPDHKDRFEPYWQDYTSRDDLVQERSDLLASQERLDRVRERYQQARDDNDGGGVSTDFLDDLDAEIEAATPPRVQRILGLSAPENDAETSNQHEAFRPAVQPLGKLDIPGL